MQENVSQIQFRRGVGVKLVHQLVSVGALAATWALMVHAMGGSVGMMLDNLMQSLASMVGY